MNGRGFTLVELMVTVAVAAVLLSVAIPPFRRLLAAEHSTAVVNQIVGAVTFARTEAIVRQRVVTLCPAADGQCLGRHQWHRGAMVFVDRNGNGRRDGDERIDRALPALRPGDRVYWRSFRNRSYLQFHPRGYTRWQNGSFLYCPGDADPRLARMVIVNAPGRARLARDRDGDGVIEDAGGSDVTCPD